MSGAVESEAHFLDTPNDACAAARSQMYALLTEAFDYPNDSAAARLLDGRLLAELRTAAAMLAAPIDVPTSLTLPTGADARDKLQVIYTRLFEIGKGSRTVSLLERRYTKKPQQGLWEDLLRFYNFFGIDLSERGLGENPDHLLIELEFMHYLGFLEAGAQKGQDDIRRGQRDFLAEHLGCWVGPFAESLCEQEDNGPYGALAIMLRELVQTHKDQ